MKKFSAIPTLLFLLLVVVPQLSMSQSENSKYVFGAGLSITKFGDEGAKFIGNSLALQIPRFTTTMYLGKGFSVEGALSFRTLKDIGLIDSSSWYISWDLHGRYDFKMSDERTVPYILAGGSLINGGINTSNTYNVGAGFTHWYDQNWGINSQAVLKISPESINSMRTHLQLSVGVVYSFGFRSLKSASVRGRLWQSKD